MPDWQELVRRRLAGMQLAENEVALVAEELAQHLEETYQVFLCQGMTDQAALRRVLEEVDNWQHLKSAIELARKKEPPMNKRVSRFWFPAFLTLLLTQVLLYAIQVVGPKPYISPAWGVPPRMTPAAVVYLAWLFILPFIGALGAYLSRRAGACPAAIFSAIAFPVFPFLGFILVGLPMAIILDNRVAHSITLPGFLVGLSAWVIFPAVALMAGCIPVHYSSIRQDVGESPTPEGRCDQ